MRYFRSFLSYCAIALASCLGFAGFAHASDAYPLTQHLRVASAVVGFHGGEYAKFKAEQTYMVSVDSVARTCSGSLTAESNGYRLSELVNVAVNDSEVAKGKIGVGAGAVA